MTHEQIAEARAVARLLDKWPNTDCTAIGYSGPVVAVVDCQAKNYCLHLTSVTL